MIALESDEWSRLTHAYGPAENIPALIRALARAVAPDDREIWDELSGALHHQGSIYPATYAAVPHIVELFIDSPIERRVDVVMFVAPLLLRVPNRFAGRSGLLIASEEAIARLRPHVADVAREAAASSTRDGCVSWLVLVFLALHASAARDFPLPELFDDDGEMFGRCPSCERPVDFVIEGDEIFEVESIDGTTRTLQRITAPSRANAMLGKARDALATDARWDAPFVFAVAAALAHEVDFPRLADVLLALDATIQCARCDVASRLVAHAE